MTQTITSNNRHKNERPHRGSFVFWFLTGVLLVIIDQLTKFYAVNGSFGDFLNWLSPVIKKEVFFNVNFAFSLPLWDWLMYLLYMVTMAAVIIYVVKNYLYFTRLTALSWVLILAGGVSNIAERLYLGYVRDFIYVATGIFNVADFFIILGVIILIFTPSLKVTPPSGLIASDRTGEAE